MTTTTTTRASAMLITRNIHEWKSENTCYHIFILIYSAFVPVLNLELDLEQVFAEGEFQQETELSL